MNLRIFPVLIFLFTLCLSLYTATTIPGGFSYAHNAWQTTTALVSIFVSFAALLLAYSVYADDNRNEDNTHWLESRLKSVETELTDENRKGIASPAIDRTFLSHKSETELEMERQEIEEREKEKLEKERSRPHAR